MIPQNFQDHSTIYILFKLRKSHPTLSPLKHYIPNYPILYFAPYHPLLNSNKHTN